MNRQERNRNDSIHSIKRIYLLIRSHHPVYQNMDFRDDKAFFLSESGNSIYHIEPFKKGFKTFKTGIRQTTVKAVSNNALKNNFFKTFDSLRKVYPPKEQ